VSALSPNSLVRAAKAHVCETCDAAIAAGQECLRTCEGGFTTWRHLRCAATLTNARGELVYDCDEFRAYRHKEAALAVDPLNGKHRVLPPSTCSDGGASESYAQLAARVLVANETY
jgi:hypothetical protein